MKVTAKNIEFEVEVSDEGIFSASFAGERYEAEQLSYLRRNLITAVESGRTELPFVDTDGDRGIIRGYHAGQRKLLVTWENGRKDQISHGRGWKLGDVSDETVAEIRALEATVAAAEARLRELRADAVDLEGMLNDHYKKNVTDSYTWARENPELVA